MFLPFTTITVTRSAIPKDTVYKFCSPEDKAVFDKNWATLRARERWDYDGMYLFDY